MTDFRRWPQTWPWFLIIPLYLLIAWFLVGVTITFVYWLKKDNEKAKKWFFYSFATLMVMAVAIYIWGGIKSGKWFKEQ